MFSGTRSPTEMIHLASFNSIFVLSEQECNCTLIARGSKLIEYRNEIGSENTRQFENSRFQVALCQRPLEISFLFDVNYCFWICVDLLIANVSCHETGISEFVQPKATIYMNETFWRFGKSLRQVHFALLFEGSPAATRSIPVGHNLILRGCR